MSATDDSLTPGDRIWLESVGADGHEGATAAEMARIDREAQRREFAVKQAVQQARCRHESTYDITTFESATPIARHCGDCGAHLPPEDHQS